MWTPKSNLPGVIMTRDRHDAATRGQGLDRKEPGRLIAVVGPSGAGKDTLLSAARSARPDLCFVRRVIDRPAHDGDEDHDSVDRSEFDRRLAEGAFAFHWRAHGHQYGVPVEIDSIMADGHDVVFNGSRAAIPSISERYPNILIVLVTAPAPVLAQRLSARGREARAEIEARLSRSEIKAPKGAVVVLNDGSIEEGLERFLQALKTE